MSEGGRSGLLQWGLLALGLLSLYVPTYLSLSKGAWQTEEQGHGPLILAVVAWLVWQKRSAFARPPESRGNAIVGVPVMLIGLLLYVLGRSQDILLFEVGSHIPVLAGVLLIAGGVRLLRQFAFPLFFIAFMVPLPGAVVDALTGPLKQHVSEIAEQILYAVGYPIARVGVTLTIGPYQLLVADACSGLHSLYSLSALGLLYLFLMKHEDWPRNIILGLAIVPIAFGANVIRVMILVLVTYHFGDEAGQGFVHGFAGMVLFVAALLALFMLDSMLGLFMNRRSPAAAP